MTDNQERDMDDPCGRYHKSVDEFPVVWEGELIGTAKDSGEDVYCRKHAFQRFGHADDECLAGTVAELRAKGYAVEKEGCDVEWADDVQLYDHGALIFAPDGN